MTEKKLLVVLIHNNESEMPSRVVASNVISTIPGARMLEVSEQKDFSMTSSWSELIQHLRMQLQIEYLWRQYRGKQTCLAQLWAGANFVRKLMLLTLVPTVRKKEWRIREIERAVSLKHQIAFKKFQESDAEILLVLESDAAWIENRSDKISTLLDLSLQNVPSYLNLAGGLSLDALGIELLTQAIGDAPLENTKRFSKPVTNTSCAYAINQELVDSLLSHTEEFPFQRSLGIDWLINAVFLEMTRQQLNVYCVHSYPPILHHGSMTGISSSWHPGRG